MATEQYRRSFTPSGGTEFWYDSPYEWDRAISTEEQQIRIPQGDTAGDGEYQGDSNQGPRVFSIRGTLIALSPSDLQSKLDALFAAHPSGKEGKLRRQIKSGSTIISDRYLTCRVSGRTKGVESGLPSNQWEIAFRAAQPFYHDWDLQPAQALTISGTGGTTSITPGGTEKAALIITLTVTAIGLITLTPSQTMGVDSASALSFQAPSPGTYIVDNNAKTLTKTGTGSMIGQIVSGGWFFLPPSATNLVLNAPSSNVSAGSAVWRRCWSIS